MEKRIELNLLDPVERQTLALLINDMRVKNSAGNEVVSMPEKASKVNLAALPGDGYPEKYQLLVADSIAKEID